MIQMLLQKNAAANCRQTPAAELLAADYWPLPTRCE
jgi:hypothetical protein